MNIPWLITGTIGIVGLLGLMVGSSYDIDIPERLGGFLFVVSACMAALLSIATLWMEFA